MSVGFKRRDKNVAEEVAEFKSKKGFTQKGVDDLVMLPNISENDIVENLKKRYNNNAIYTNIGPVLIVVNPFKDLGITGNDYINIYKGKFRHELPPHIFALAEETFRNMKNEKESQCCIISGESGAGKTVAAKQIMQYISAVSGGDEKVEYVKSVILDSNPLLEAFGNAKTVRNNNSSRFGKYFEIQFDGNAHPVGGKITNYLLEKSRVCNQQPGERNFHVFYQLLAGAPDNYWNDFSLMEANNFYYLNQSQCYDVDDVDDKAEFQATQKAMDTVGIDQQEQYYIFQLVAAILHLGNVYFVENDRGYAQVAERETLELAAYLLEVSADDLERCMTIRKIVTRQEVFDSPLNTVQAETTKNAICKEIYDRIFTMLVEKVNVALGKWQLPHTCVIGILDIFGFEIFNKNGFEQFCINYVNEKLQQYFIELTLKAEQEEYVEEGIKWTEIKYFNNKIVCDLIEGKNPPGIFSLLDDICATLHAQSEGADEKFIQKVASIHGDHPHFLPSGNIFTIRHYAGDVNYDIDGFCEKNKDTLFADCIEVIQSTQNNLLYELFPQTEEQKAAQTGQKKRPTTAGFKIKTSCNQLMTELSKCRPHYIRCIKPNEVKKPQVWEADRVKHQVKYLGLLENVKVRRAGFAFRTDFARFLFLYKKLSPETWGTWGEWTGDPKEGCQKILNALPNLEQGQWQFGKTKLFIRLPESIFAIEEMLERRDFDFTVTIQRAWKGYKNRKRALEHKAEAAKIYMNKKERLHTSVNARWDADYINYENEIPLQDAMDPYKEELVVFTDFVFRLNKKGRLERRTLLVTDKAFYMVCMEVKKKVATFVVTFRGEITKITSIDMSTLADNYLVIRFAGLYDTVIEAPHKTELVMMLLELYRELTNGNSFSFNFSDTIHYRGKDEKKDSILTFKKDENAIPLIEQQQKFSMKKFFGSGSVTIGVKSGLPSNTDTSPKGFSIPGGVKAEVSSAPSQIQNFAAPKKAPAAPAPAAPRAPPPAPKKPQCQALYAYTAQNETELSFKKGDVINILQKEEGWWEGELNGQVGWLPFNYVKEL